MVAGDVVDRRDLHCLLDKAGCCLHIGAAGVEKVAGDSDNVRLRLAQQLKQRLIVLPEGSVVQVGDMGDPGPVKGGGQSGALHCDAVQLHRHVAPNYPDGGRHNQ